MGRAVEILTGFVTAPSSTFTAWTMASGDSLTIRSAGPDSRILLLQAWGQNQTAGNLRVRGPRLHDNVQGMRFFCAADQPDPLMPIGIAQRLRPLDVLTVEQTGSAVAGDIEQGSLLVWYENLPGSDARLIDADELMRRAVSMTVVENTLSTGTAGGYSGEEAINVEFDQFKADHDYALAGYLVSSVLASIGWRGADTANLRLGGPGLVGDRAVTASWFVNLSRAFGMPLIPVFNSNNRAGILVDCAQDEDGADPVVSSIFVELGPSAGR